MENEFVGYEAAKRLKALGFDEPCIAVYGYNMQEGYPEEMKKRLVLAEEVGFTEGRNVGSEDLRNSVLGEDISAPTFSQVFRWFKEKYRQNAYVTNGLIYSFVINSKKYEDYPNYEDNWFRSYEEAERACLEELIRITEEI